MHLYYMFLFFMELYFTHFHLCVIANLIFSMHHIVRGFSLRATFLFIAPDESTSLKNTTHSKQQKKGAMKVHISHILSYALPIGIMNFN